MIFRYIYFVVTLVLTLFSCLNWSDVNAQKATMPPEYKGGNQALIKFIAEKMEYPEHAKETGLQGIVYVEALVRKNGQLDSLRVIYSRGPEWEKELGEEALRITKLMPTWLPAKDANSKPKEEKVRIPFRFKINSDN